MPPTFSRIVILLKRALDKGHLRTEPLCVSGTYVLDKKNYILNTDITVIHITLTLHKVTNSAIHNKIPVDIRGFQAVVSLYIVSACTWMFKSVEVIRLAFSSCFYP